MSVTAPGEASPESQTQSQRPPEAGNALPPAARTRAEWRQFMQQEELDRLQKIESERDQKKRRAEELKSAAAGQKTAETWTSNKTERPMLGPLDITDRAKAEISKNVDAEFSKNTALFSEVGLTSPENISSLKNVAKEIIFEHFTKTGAKQDKTESYVKSELVPKLTETFDSLKKIFEANKQAYSSPLQFLEAFGTFCGLNIMAQGRLNEANIKTLLLVNRSGLQALVSGFREYAPASADAARLDREAAALLDTGRQRSGQSAPAPTPGTTPAPAPGTTPPVPPAPGTAPATAPPAAPGTAPAATPPAAPGEAPAQSQTVPSSAETAPTAPGSTTETPAPQPGQSPAEGQAPTEGQTAESAEGEIKTGNPIMDMILNALKSFFPASVFDKIMTWLNKLGLGSEAAAEFAGLEEAEKKEALVLKEACTQLGLNDKITTILYKDAGQIKKILADKAGLINTGWSEFLQQRLDPQELELLKKDPGIDTQTADKIAAMFLSPAAATSPPTAAQTATAPTAAQTATPAAPAASPPPATQPPASTPPAA